MIFRHIRDVFDNKQVGICLRHQDAHGNAVSAIPVNPLRVELQEYKYTGGVKHAKRHGKKQNEQTQRKSAFLGSACVLK